MKKLFVSIVLAGSLAALAFAGCASGGEQNNNGIAGGKFEELSTTSSVYAFSAASAGMIISAQGTSAAATDVMRAESAIVNPVENNSTPDAETPATDAENPDTGTTTPDAAAVENAGLDGYMELVGSLLSDGGFEITESASDRPEYETKTTFAYSDISGERHTYEMYYNATQIPDDDDDDRDDHDEIEEEFAIDGIMIIDGAEYAIRGESENEAEGNESESETELTVDLGNGRRMVVEQSYETENGETEQEYSYLLYDNGTLIERSSFEYEVEDDETEVMMTSLKDGQTEQFYFTCDTRNGREVLRLRVGTGRDAKHYHVVPATDADGNVTYTYELIER